jgi:CheY-like chemotaxis protein
LNILVLEDDEERHKRFSRNLIGHDFVIVASVQSAIFYLKKKNWDMLYLDHDLGGQVYVPSGPNTGYEVAKWLEENPEYKPTKIILHSFNPVGAENMQQALPEAIKYPGAWDKKPEDIDKWETTV